MIVTVTFWKSAPSIKPIQRKRKSEDFKGIRALFKHALERVWWCYSAKCVTVKILNHYTYYIKIPHEICSDNCKIILHVSWGIFLNVKFGKYGKINYQTNILHFQQPGFTFFRYKKIQDCKVFYIYLTFFSPETLHSPLILVL